MEKMKGDMLEMILSSEKGRLAERNTQFLLAQVRPTHTGNAAILLHGICTSDPMCLALLARNEHSSLRSKAWKHPSGIRFWLSSSEALRFRIRANYWRTQFSSISCGHTRVLRYGHRMEASIMQSAACPLLLAPEVLRNKGFNRSLDMWSVGVIVYVRWGGICAAAEIL